MRLKINNEYYDHFTDLEISASLDSVASSFSIGCRWDSTDLKQRQLFNPLSYTSVHIYDDNDLILLTGTLLNHSLGSGATSELLSLSGYSKCGIIEDCSIPRSAYPLESTKRSLSHIASKFLSPFNVKFKIHPSVSKQCAEIYAKTSAKPEESVKDYLAKLAAQKNVILSHDKNGDLVFFKADVKKEPKLTFDKSNCIMALEVNGQNMHSEITIVRQPKSKRVKRESKNILDEDFDEETTPVKTKKMPLTYDTIKNPLVKIFRPIVKKMSEGEDVDTSNAAKNALADELRNIKINIEVEKIIDIWIGDVVNIENDEIFLYKKNKMIVESFSISKSSDNEKTTISLVLPESFTGDIPKNIFL